MSSDPIGPQLLLQAALIAVNAFFAATEIALISLNDNKLRRDAESGDKKSMLLLRIAQEPTSFLSTIQIGITLAGFLGSAFAADNFAGRLTALFANRVLPAWISLETINAVAVVLITLVLSYFTLVFGELVPKRVAMKRPEKVARFTCGVINVVYRVAKPAIWLLTKSTNGILRLLRINPNEEPEEVSEEEILYMVDVGEEKGAIEPNEKEMIANIFEFNDLTAADLMVHRRDMIFVSEDDDDASLLATVRDSHFSRFPVCGEDADDVKGILMARDYLLNRNQPDPLPLSALVRPAYFVPESVCANVLLKQMQAEKTHMAIVVDEYGGTGGLITMEDLLEEIVGNIYDESDVLPKEEEIHELAPGRWRVSGQTELETLAKMVKTALPLDEEFDTLGGLILNQLSRIPAEGSHPELSYGRLHIRVEEVRERRVEWATVWLEKDEPKPEDAKNSAE